MIINFLYPKTSMSINPLIYNKYTSFIDRQKYIIDFGLLTHNINIGYYIENSIFEYSILYIINGHYNKKLFYSIYLNKINSVYNTIKNNPSIIKSIISKLINPKFIAFIPNHILCPERWKDFIERQNKLEERKKNIPTTDMYKCPHCHQHKCTTRVVQTRSSDEALTTFIICCVCGTTFKS